MKTNPMRNRIACYAINPKGEYEVFLGVDSTTVHKTFTTFKACEKYVSDYNEALANEL